MNETCCTIENPCDEHKGLLTKTDLLEMQVDSLREIVSMLITDITELKELTEKLRHDKMCREIAQEMFLKNEGDC